ncbi:nucleotide disphospho-sugar-binding domain-containing protein [Streptomyces aureocirculatus]|uniref:nucleotide disphospho-sugar-binding domain-containing protein n=1 Tax=Streptomyces aureocirculatus TaxID=67275 RepID=UPI0004C967EC|nr:nucleotide disphospho-sugar-binding domain-containing protein [Streptomyces aureocirculatus]
MRILFATTPGIGHSFPTVPLAWALRLAGHEVLYATGGDALAIRDAGLPVEDVCPGQTVVSMVQETFAARPDLAADYAEVDHSSFESTQRFYAVLLNQQTAMMDRYVSVAQEWKPDAVVFSSLGIGGLLAAGKVGVPAFEHGYGFVHTGRYTRDLREWNAECFERHDAELPEVLHTIDIAPPSVAGGSAGWPLRHLPYNGGGVVPEWLHTPSGRPRITVTLGTTAPGFGGLGPLDRVIELAAGTDAEFVLALGDIDTSSLPKLPDNARLAGWVPLGLLLDKSAGLIHHGGSGTTLAALEAGLPQILMPDQGERAESAERVAARGAGLNVRHDEISEEHIAALLNDDALRKSATEVREEIHAMPLPAAVAERLVTTVKG